MNRATTTKIADVLSREAERAMREMRIPGHRRPYFLGYLLRDEDHYRIDAKYGAITVDTHYRNRNCLCDVRVGSYRQDQVRSGGLYDNSKEVESYDMIGLPFDGSADGLRHGLWRLTEARYREAIDAWLQKRAESVAYVDEHRSLPAFERREAVRDDRFQRLPEPDLEHWRHVVRKASGTYRKYPLLRNGGVSFTVHNAVHVYASSEGALQVQTFPWWRLGVDLWVLAKNGHGFSHTHAWFVTDPDELPSLPEINRTIGQIYRRLVALSEAPKLRSYSGPVLLDPKPAGLLVHEALGHRFEGNRLLSSGEGQTFRDASGEPVLPEGVTVRDDPRLDRFEGQSLVGHYRYDDEGIPAGDARLIEDGAVSGFLTSRTPVGRKHASNGHGRSSYHARAMSRMAVTLVEAEDGQGLSDADLKKAFVEEIRRQGVPYGIRILDAVGGETSTESYDFQAFLGDIGMATRVFPDGREELIRGVDFVGTPLNAVRSVLAVGERKEVDNAFCGAESGYVPVSTISPAMLISHLELQTKPDRLMTQYAYPMPWESEER